MQRLTHIERQFAIRIDADFKRCDFLPTYGALAVDFASQRTLSGPNSSVDALLTAVGTLAGGKIRFLNGISSSESLPLNVNVMLIGDSITGK